MGVWFRAATPVAEQRSVFPTISMGTYAGYFGGGTYADVSAEGVGALQSVAVGSSVRLICRLMSELPLHVYRGEGKDRRRLTTPGNLLDPAGDGYGLEDWLYRAGHSLLYRGNLYGSNVEWMANGRPTRLDLFNPDDVSPQMDGARGKWLIAGREYEGGGFVHVRAFPEAGRIVSPSPLMMHAVQVRTSLAVAMFGDQWFREGAAPSGMLVNDAPIDQTSAETAKARFMARIRGSREPVVMGQGWKWTPLGVAANESQFLETARWSEAECARIFGPAVPETLGYETGGSMTYANVVDRRSDLLTLSLNPWLSMAERVLSTLLPSPQYAKFNRDAFLESTTLARYEAHAKAAGWKLVNEIRDDEDMPAVPWGDVPLAAVTGKTTGQQPAGGVVDGDPAGA